MKYARVFVPLILLALGAGFFWYRADQEEKKKQREANELLAQHRASASQYLILIQGVVTNIASMDAAAQQQARKAEEAVLAVTGSKFDRDQIRRYMSLPTSEAPPRTKEEPSKLEKTKPPPPPPKGPEGVLSPAQLEALRKAQEDRRSDTKKPDGAAQKPAVAPPPTGDEDAPPGEMTRAQIDAMRQRSGQPALPSTDTAAPDGQPVPAPVTDGATPPSVAPRPRPGKPAAPKPPEIALVAGQVVGEATAIAEKAAAAQTILTAAEQAASAVYYSCRSPRESATYVAQLDEQLKIVKAHESDIQQALFALSEPVQNVLALQAKAEKEKEEQRRAEEKRQREEAHKKLVTEELAAVGDLKAKNADLLKQYRYDDILKAFAAKEAELQTDEAKSALKAHAERFTYLQKLKTFVMNSLNGRPFKWGWGAGASAKDILGANDEGIRLTGGDRIGWTEIPLAQMIKIIEYCFTDPNIDRKVRSEQTLAYGIFHLEHGNPDGAQSRLKEILEKYPTVKEEAERLLRP